MTKELQQEITNIYEDFIKLSSQDDTDYENVKKIIEDSDLMLKNYRKQYGDIIREKNNEIEQLQERLKTISSQNELLRTFLYNVPEDIRKKYDKNAVTSF